MNDNAKNTGAGAAASASDILLAGNILVDIVKNIDCYPEIGMLASITSVKQAVGGCVTNTGIDLAKMDPALKLGAIGKVGQDAYGDYAVEQMNLHGIDTSRVRRSETAPTSFSDVMSQPSGERTFFHARGANAEFGPTDVDLTGLSTKIFHMGYIMLLDTFDQDDAEYGTVMARLLSQVQAMGIKTSIDAVSDSLGSYQTKIPPALRYSNYAIVNEIESCGIYGLSPRNADGSLSEEAIREAMNRMAKDGVQDKVVVHCKEAGFCLDVPTGTFTRVNSLKVPKEMIAGSVGAGDAFCAGCLYSLSQGYSDAEMLAYASAAAACNLFSENSVDGMKTKDEIWEMAQNWERLHAE